MRPTQTAGEAASISALIEAFRSDGHIAELVPRAVHDKPDALLHVAGHLIACECIQIPPSSILQHMHRRPRDADWRGQPILSYVWPNEPHQWIADAIRKKTALVPGYLESTGAAEAWLLVHTPPEHNQSFMDTSQEWIQFAVRHGAGMEPHPFAQVHVWTPQHGIFPAWSRKLQGSVRTELRIDFSAGYPTMCMNRFTLPFRTLGPGSTFSRELRVKLSGMQEALVSPVDADYGSTVPAVRPASYDIQLLVERNRAVMTYTPMFVGEPELGRQAPLVMQDLAPATNYWFHAIHEFRAPKTFNSWHLAEILQPPSSPD